MFQSLRNLLGLNPPLPGLESLLDDVRDSRISTVEAAERIRALAGRPHIPPWFPQVFRLMGGVFAIVGVGFLLYSVYFSVNTESTIGTVIEMRGQRGQSPVVEYAVQGQRFVHHSSLYSNPPSYNVGDPVDILYNPASPTSSQIDSFEERWLFPVVFVFGGLLLYVVSFLLPKWLQLLTGAG